MASVVQNDGPSQDGMTCTVIPIVLRLTMIVDEDDDDDEAMRERRTAGRVALSAAHCPVFEPLTYHTPAAIQ